MSLSVVRNVGGFVALVLVVSVPYTSTGQELYRANIQPTATDNFSQASFTLWVPEEANDPGFMLVLVPGSNGDGDKMLQVDVWRDFAAKKNAAILACTFKGLPKNQENRIHYAAAHHGSGNALEQGIRILEEKASLNVSQLPLAIYGHSAGGQFAYGFTCHNPGRVLGFVAVKGGYYFPRPVDGTFEVPGLIVSGEDDKLRRRNAIQKLYESHRKEGAPWCWLEDAHGHGQEESATLACLYFHGLLSSRLANSGRKLKKYEISSGIVIDLQSKDEAKDSGIQALQNPRLGFLPTRDTYKLWHSLDIGKRKYERSDQE